MNIPALNAYSFARDTAFEIIFVLMFHDCIIYTKLHIFFTVPSSNVTILPPLPVATVTTLTKIRALIVYFLYTNSIHRMYYIAMVYIFSIHQIYIKQDLAWQKKMMYTLCIHHLHLSSNDVYNKYTSGL